jgi:integrase
MPLTDVAVRNAKGRDKPYKMTDGAGLYLLVKPDGGRYWRFDYRHLSKRGTLAFGVYPTVPVSEAREKREAARKLLSAGKDPSLEKKKARAIAQVSAANTFKAVGEELIAKLTAEGLVATTLDNIRRRIGLLYPGVGETPIDQIEAPELLALLRKIEARGQHDTASRTRSDASRVFRYAIATGRAKRDPAADLKGALTTPQVQHHPTIFEPKEVGRLLLAIDGYRGERQVVSALKLALHVFVRPFELRTAEWSEFDLKAAEWRIPGPKMKMKRDHIVPLSTQALAIVQELFETGTKGTYLFAGMTYPDRPMSSNTATAAFRRMGYTSEELTGHGLRRTASTMLNEMGWNSDWIERQLAHVEGNTVRRTYNAAEYLPDRRRMMQAWSDHLDALRASVRQDATG